MIYSVEIILYDIITENITDNLYQSSDFTLTVNAVNDAPVLLQSLEAFEIVEDSGTAAMVLYTVFGDVSHLIHSDNLYQSSNFYPNGECRE